MKCGRPIPEAWKRNVQKESALIEHACQDQSVAQVVNWKRVKRSGYGWVRDILNRNFTIEGDEELLDFCNYAVWLDQQRKIRGLEGLSAGQRHALSLVLEAYSWWHQGDED